MTDDTILPLRHPCRCKAAVTSAEPGVCVERTAPAGFALKDPNVTAIRPEIDQFDYWFNSANHAGKDALVLANDEIGIANVEPHFDRLTELRDTAISRFDQPLLNYQIYLAEGFRP